MSKLTYFCTAGRGSEIFLVDEIEKKLHCREVSSIDGKIFFSTPSNLQQILELKTAERVFALAYHDTNSIKKQKGSIVNEVCEILLNKAMWTQAESAARAIWQNPRAIDGKSESKRRRVCADTDEESFRLSVKCSGSFARIINTQMLSRCLGPKLSRIMGWKINLRSPDFEVSVNIGHDYITAGIPLTQTPLSRRTYLREFGLRSTICWIMAHLADIQDGNTVLDPMCGKGTILIEAAKSCSNGCVYIGGDISQDQLSSASLNVSHARVSSVVLIKSSALALPFCHGFIDVVLCDAPFGHNHKTSTDLRQFYGDFLREAHRVLQNDGRLVLLTSVEMGDYLQTAFCVDCRNDVSGERCIDATVQCDSDGGKMRDKGDASDKSDGDDNFLEQRDVSLPKEPMISNDCVVLKPQHNHSRAGSGECLNMVSDGSGQCSNLVGEKSGKCLNAVGDSRECLDTVVDRSRECLDSVGDRSGEFPDTVGDRSGEFTDTVGDRSVECPDTVGERSVECPDTVGERSVECPDTVVERSVECPDTVVERSVECPDTAVNTSHDWRMIRKHYLKLGDTHAYVCVMTKL